MKPEFFEQMKKYEEDEKIIKEQVKKTREWRRTFECESPAKIAERKREERLLFLQK